MAPNPKHAIVSGFQKGHARRRWSRASEIKIFGEYVGGEGAGEPPEGFGHADANEPMRKLGGFERGADLVVHGEPAAADAAAQSVSATRPGWRVAAPEHLRRCRS